MKPFLTIIAGANGSGKSYFSEYFMQIGLVAVQAINIDALEESVDLNRISDDPLRYQKSLRKEIDTVFLTLCKDAIKNKKDFAFETNLRTDQLSAISLFEKADYSIQLIFIWLDNIEISKERVKIRVNEGGHPVGVDSIKGNYIEGLENLDYSVSDNHWDKVYLIDNSKDAKHKGDTLYLLLELEKTKINRCSDNFFSLERERHLPNICKMIRNMINMK